MMSHQPSSPQPTNPTTPESLQGTPAKKKRSLVRTVVLMLVGLLCFGGFSLGGAEYYTSRPDFCGSCHIMDPYYKSWSKDQHGAKVGARCVDCHYAPGEQHTIKAKFKGLSQATSYFSGRYGAGRPRAKVNNASCLVSGCHGDNAFMTKAITLGETHTEIRMVGDQKTSVERAPTVHFSHEKHLQAGARIDETVKALADLRATMKKSLPSDAFEQLTHAVTSVGNASARQASLKKAIATLSVETREPEIQEWMRLEHDKTRMLQLEGLNCASCHNYDATGKHHIAVDRAACYTCHFTGQTFNHGTGACLKCHEPPVRQIAIHTTPTTATGSAPAQMDHREIVTRGIDCASCHADVVQGETQVTTRDCTHCHDQESYLADFDKRTTKTVEMYHAEHVKAQRARCADCHRAMQHNLVEPGLAAGSSAALAPVVNDCQHCHPSHHKEQLNLLVGIGGSGIKEPMPNAMFGSRINCRACHTQSGNDFKGDVLVSATKQACVACHSGDYEKLFDQWVNEIKHSLEETEKLLAGVQKRIDVMKASNTPIPASVADAIVAATTNIQLVKSGHGIHNKAYALQLLDISTRQLDEATMAIMPK
ncbi:MAG: NapC/NirT family cytochrome c [Planctomycetota bacterium]